MIPGDGDNDFDRGVFDALNRGLENNPELATMTVEELAIDLSSYDADYEYANLELIEAACGAWIRWRSGRSPIAEAFRLSLDTIGGHGVPYCPYGKTDEAHLRWMLENLPEDEGQANRWLGYAQGVLVALGVATVEEFRNINREVFA